MVRGGALAPPFFQLVENHRATGGHFSHLTVIGIGRRLRTEASSSLTLSTEARIHGDRHPLNNPEHQPIERVRLPDDSPVLFREVRVNRLCHYRSRLVPEAREAGKYGPVDPY